MHSRTNRRKMDIGRATGCAPSSGEDEAGGIGAGRCSLHCPSSEEEPMTQHAVGDSAISATSGSTSRGVSGWVGWIAFAGTLMVMLGTFHVIDGLVALFNDEYYLVTKSGLIVTADYTAWGWVHLILGI